MKMLADNEADITLLAFRISSKRMMQASFTTPIDYLSYGYIAQEISIGTFLNPCLEEMYSQDFIFRVFTPTVYLCIFMVTLLASIILVIAHRLHIDTYPKVLGQNLTMLIRQHELHQGIAPSWSACVSFYLV